MRRLLRIGFGLVLIGFVGMIVFGIVSGEAWSDAFITADEYTMVERTYTVDEFSKLMVDVEDKSIEVGVSDDTDIHITYYVHEKSPVISTIEDDTLSVENHILWYNYFLLNFDWFAPSAIHELIILIPSDYVSSMNLHTSNGTIYIGEDLSFTELGASTSNGAITLENIDVSSDLTITSSNGVINVDGLVVSGDFLAITSNGKIDVDTISADKVELSTSNGAIEAKNVSSNNIVLDTSNGNITMNSLSSFDTTYLKMSTSNGSYYINGDKVSTNSYHDGLSVKIDLHTSNGNVYVNFPN
ncbi:MAG: DUF4097 domain-containing protein [Candidatus Izemoplasmatales bacterium]